MEPNPNHLRWLPYAQSPAMAAALARVLLVALLFGAAAVPAYVAGVEFAAWGLALLAASLAVRMPMSGLLANLGSGVFLLLTVVGLAAPELLGPAGIVDENPWMRACAWLTLAASVLTLVLVDVGTFRRVFRQEGRPVVTFDSDQLAAQAQHHAAARR
ncbi:MAG: hypothetical protein AB2A00_43555 [Myxococcota bacterium]